MRYILYRGFPVYLLAYLAPHTTYEKATNQFYAQNLCVGVVHIPSVPLYHSMVISSYNRIIF